MGRYANCISVKFSQDEKSPTFEDTVNKARLIYIRHMLEKMTPQEQADFIRWGKEEGILT